MSDKVILVENLSKQYRLGEVGVKTFSHDMKRLYYSILGKEDPFSKVGDENVRDAKGTSDFVWALKDVNFHVNRGEVLGIVGKNGAGKSTLLKILSRVTTPSTGTVKSKGRIASLLEVGTGFHPELSGRQNVFLNGAILGMNKNEIKAKFDEIVDFSGVERYIDTPVKRYSSGMYVRLAFAVAAHLEPEILIVDEVLAVGDAEFQRKCLGKIQDVSGHGRTVLFVSHNMPAVRGLCTRCLLMRNGKVDFDGKVDEAISKYISYNYTSSGGELNIDIPNHLSLHQTGEGKFIKAWIENTNGNKTDSIRFREKIKVKLQLKAEKDLEQVNISVGIVSKFGETVATAISSDKYYSRYNLQKGLHEIEVLIDTALMPDFYALNFGISHFNTGVSIDYVEYFYPFKVEKETLTGDFEYPWDTVHGYNELKSEWKLNKLS